MVSMSSHSYYILITLAQSIESIVQSPYQETFNLNRFVTYGSINIQIILATSKAVKKRE